MRKIHKDHENLFSEARQIFPGGVNSPVRSFGSVGGTPRFFRSGSAGHIYDSQGKKYIDLVQSWGAHILGHRPRAVERAVREQLGLLWSSGTPTEMEIRLGKRIKQAFPSIDLLRFTSSGTEACMSALRLARGYTGRSMIIKFDGCYHGHSDALLAKTGTTAAEGIPSSVLGDTISLPYQDIKAVQQTFLKYPGQISAVIVEPIAANMGLIIPNADFLSSLDTICARNNSLLIFDEVVSGFRFHFGGAQQIYGITPDLTILGKIIGGGLPCGAFGGRKEVMRKIAPLGPVYQAGTLSGNPLAMSAGTAVLDRLAEHKTTAAFPFNHRSYNRVMTYQNLEKVSSQFFSELQQLAKKSGCSLAHAGGAFTLFCRSEPPENLIQAQECDTERYARLFHNLIGQGVYTTPSQFEVQFLPLSTSQTITKRILTAYKKALKDIA